MAGPQRLRLGWLSCAHALREPEGGSGRVPQRGPTLPCFFSDTGVWGEMNDVSLREGSLAGQCLRKAQASAQIGTPERGSRHHAPGTHRVLLWGCVRSKALCPRPASSFWGGWRWARHLAHREGSQMPPFMSFPFRLRHKARKHAENSSRKVKSNS